MQETSRLMPLITFKLLEYMTTVLLLVSTALFSMEQGVMLATLRLTQGRCL